MYFTDSSNHIGGNQRAPSTHEYHHQKQSLIRSTPPSPAASPSLGNASYVSGHPPPLARRSLSSSSTGGNRGAEQHATVSVQQGSKPGEIYMPQGIVDMASFGQILAMDEIDPTREFSKALVWAWCDQAEMAVEEMEHFLARRDLVAIGDKAHYLKGSSSSLGLVKVSETCQHLYWIHYPPSLAQFRNSTYAHGSGSGNSNGSKKSSSSSSSSGASSSANSFMTEHSTSSFSSSTPSSTGSSGSPSPTSEKPDPFSTVMMTTPQQQQKARTPPMPPIVEGIDNTAEHAKNAAKRPAARYAASGRMNSYSHNSKNSISSINTIVTSNSGEQNDTAMRTSSIYDSHQYCDSLSGLVSSPISANSYSSSAPFAVPSGLGSPQMENYNGRRRGSRQEESVTDNQDFAAQLEDNKLGRAKSLLDKLKEEIRQGSEWLYTYYQESDRYAGVPQQ